MKHVLKFILVFLLLPLSMSAQDKQTIQKMDTMIIKLYQKENYQKCVEVLDKQQTLVAKLLGEQDTTFFQNLRLKARCQYRLKDYQGAVKSAQDAVEAYSDTTSVDSSDYAEQTDEDQPNSIYSPKNYDSPFDYFGTIFGKAGLVVICILCLLIGLLFVFAPFIILFLILRYMYRRHQDRIKLAEMAMERGQQIPESPKFVYAQSDSYLLKRGIRNTFLALGLGAMFCFWGWSFMVGICALVFFYGLGQMVIGALPQIKELYQTWKDNKGVNQSNDI